MELSLLERTLASVVSLTVLSSPAFLAVLGASIGIAAGSVGLVTALINRRLALAAREAQRSEQARTAEESEAVLLLPPRLPHFVDRADAIERAVEQIRGGERAVAIEGESGVGKSAVATEVAYRLSTGAAGAIPAPGCRYLWIDGKDRVLTLAHICEQVTLLTGDQSVSTLAGEAKLQAIRAHLARNRTVLLLDDLRVASGPAGEPVRELLRTVPTESLVIAAVNSPYALDAARVFLQELEPRYVRDLIDYQAQRRGLDPSLFDDAFAARLQEAVGGNPRLIESFLKAVSDSAAPVEELFDAIERGEGLRDLFLPVWRDVDPRSRSVLAACACLGGQAIADQLEVACELSHEALAGALGTLVRAGLMTVLRSAGRPELYVCPPNARRFALAETGTSAIAAFAKRLSAYYIRQFGREPENAHWAVPHVVGIEAVLEWLSEHGQHAEVQVLFASVLDVFMTLGLFDGRIRTGLIAYDSAIEMGNHRAASLATDVLASTHAARGELEEAREAAALGAIAAEASRDGGERARQMRVQGLWLYKSREAVRALEAMEGADALVRESGDLEILVNILGLRTVAHWYIGALADSAGTAREALRVCEEMSWQRATAYPLRNLAEVAISRGEFQRAGALLANAGEVASAFADRRQMARVRLTSARMHLFGRNLANAAAEALAAESDAIELGLAPELREARAIRLAVARARLLPPLGVWYSHRRPPRLTDAPVGGD